MEPYGSIFCFRKVFYKSGSMKTSHRYMKTYFVLFM